ncbi:MAG: dihydrodipicolinate synthase family protein [Sphaerochaetaceae bacterium]|nr:dihydrodipicolinate synthase family protein [Sphaerochaetaceae bacterium]
MNVDFIKGIIPPIVTPIDENEKVDEKALRKHIDFMIDGGISGILAFGSNGEFYMQEEDEMEQVLKIIVDQNAGRVPVYMGVGAIRTSKCIRLANMGMENGADGVSVLQPMFLKPSEDELYTHFASIADSIKGAPMLLYNNPGRTGYGISQDIVERLAHEKDNVVGMKDSSGDITQTAEYIRRNRDVNFKVLCGKDTLIYSGLTLGTCGAVCSTANFLPKLIVSIYDKFMAGDIKGSLEAQFVLNPIRLQMDKSSFPVATKDYANLLGEYVGNPYLPNKPSTEAQMAGLRNQLVKGGFLK